MGAHIHRVKRVKATGRIFCIIGTTPDGRGDYMERILDTSGALIATVHGATEMQTADRAAMVEQAINEFLRKG
jgi:hypothetical protein